MAPRTDLDPDRRERVERVTHRVIGASFLALAAYVAVESVATLWEREAPVLVLAIGALVFSRRHSSPTVSPSEPVASAYQASDPSRLAATGQPQLVEFFHHA